MKREGIARIAGTALLIIAVAFLVIASIRTHTVNDMQDDMDALIGIPPEERIITEFELLVDATFSGVRKQDGALWTTYDRDAPRGKQACPT